MHEIIFEKIKHIDEEGNEYWYARELMTVLQYKKWQNFKAVINNARLSCVNSNIPAHEQFTDVSKPLVGGNGNIQNVLDYKLTRYACYLITQNADPRKEIVALGQTYFAIQTRRMELLNGNYELLDEEEKRLYNRELIKRGNKSLNNTASKAGVRNFAKFTNYGYKGLYNGETANDIFKRKGLKYREDILDNMCSEELSANIFRIDQTTAKIKREKLTGFKDTSEAHYEIGLKVRKAISDMGGTMPENLPTPNRCIKEIENKKER